MTSRCSRSCVRKSELFLFNFVEVLVTVTRALIHSNLSAHYKVRRRAEDNINFGMKYKLRAFSGIGEIVDTRLSWVKKFYCPD